MKSISGIVTMAAVAYGMSSCVTPPSEDAAIWNKPPRYGHGGTQGSQDGANDGQKKNRFGFGGQGNTTAQSGNRFGAGAPTNDGNLGTTAGTNSGNANSGTAKTDNKTKTTKMGGSKSVPPRDLKSYPFGNPVPGKSGFVTLPSPHDGLGEIDVLGIAPGTKVEIDDPTKPGKKIYFRVP